MENIKVGQNEWDQINQKQQNFEDKIIDSYTFSQGNDQFCKLTASILRLKDVF